MKRILSIMAILSASIYSMAQTCDWGIISLCCAHLRAESRHGSEMVTQAIMGTPVKVLATENEWYQVETPEGYRAWVHPQSITLHNDSAMQSWRSAQRYIYNNMSGYIYQSPHADAMPVSDMVLGCIVEGKAVSNNGYIEVYTPDGRQGYVRANEVSSLNSWAQQLPDLSRLEHEARMMMGATYLWGGMSVKGADCSGYSKLLYFSQGIILLRDASQQATAGEVVDFSSIDNLQRGDLLFFGNDEGRINHVAIYLNGGRYIHSSGYVKINSLIEGDALYNEQPILATRRILTAVDSEGIVLVKSHPWYF